MIFPVVGYESCAKRPRGIHASSGVGLKNSVECGLNEFKYWIIIIIPQLPNDPK